MTVEGPLKKILTTTLVLPLFALNACGVRQYAPPATPSAQLTQPMPPAPPPVPGAGQVALEVQDGPAEVSEIVGSYQLVTVSRYGTSVTPGEIGQGLCRTPCTATLAFGSHDLRFRSLVDPDRTSTASVVVGPQPTGYRHALGLANSRGGVRLASWVLVSLGIGALVTGATFGAIAESGFDGWPLGMTIGGAIGFGAGIGLLIAFPPEFQPGSGVQFALPAGAPPPPPSASQTTL